MNSEDFMAQARHLIREVTHAPGDAPSTVAQPTVKDQLADFAAKTDEQRKEVLNQMIVQCLEDENFIELYHAVERDWRRVMFED